MRSRSREKELTLDCKWKRPLWNGRVWSEGPWNHGSFAVYGGVERGGEAVMKGKSEGCRRKGQQQ